MGYRHLIQEEFNEYLGTKTKYVDIDGVRFYDETIEDTLSEEELEKRISNLDEMKAWEEQQPTLEDLGLKFGGRADFNKIDWDNWDLKHILDELYYLDSLKDYDLL
jgi:hypothetical protein